MMWRVQMLNRSLSELKILTLKILMQRWRPDLEVGISKTATHLALDDIRESIEELRYYRRTFLSP